MTMQKLSMIKALRKVKVSKPPDEIIEAGNRKIDDIFHPVFPGMKAKHCQTNSICIVEAMLEKGQKDWHVVSGFAYRPQMQGPIVHVWVRNASKHYDPTWSLKVFGWNVQDLTYFEFLQALTTHRKTSNTTDVNRLSHSGEEILDELKEFAIHENIILLDPNKEA